MHKSIPERKKCMKKVVVVLLLMLTLGCARVQLVQRDGIPLPPETINITNPETGILVESVFLRYYEDSPESIYPEFLDFHKINELSDYETTRTTNVILFLRVTNPKQVKYKVIKYIRDGTGKDDYRRDVMYTGDAVMKHFQLKMPIVEDRLIQIQADVADEEDAVLFKLGYFNVKFGKLKE